MYENNYNYVDITPEPKKKKSGAGKTIALVMACVIAGGASGVGSSMLMRRMAPDRLEEPGQIQTQSQSQTAVTVPQIKEPPVRTADNGETAVTDLLSTAGGESGELTTKQIVKKVTPSVVSIKSIFNNGRYESGGTGTGIVISPDGYIITNAHVVQADTQEYVADERPDPYGGGYGNGYDDIFKYFFGGGSYRKVTKQADKVTVVLSDDSSKEYTAEVVGADSGSDIAVIKIDTEGKQLTAAELGDSDKIEMGDRALVIGYPLGMGLSASAGIVSGLDREVGLELTSGGAASIRLIQTDAPINAGNSGGPLVNAYGQIIGITSSKLVDSSVEGMGFAIPITDAMPIISDLMNQGYVTNNVPQIGITGTNINDAVRRYYGLPVNKGVMVVSVAEGSGAQAAGICEGDVIIAADGTEISSMEELTEIKSKKKIGDTMTLTLARAENNEDVEITLTSSDSIKSEPQEPQEPQEPGDERPADETE